MLAIALAALRRRGRERLSGALYAGAGAALLISGGVAVAATRVTWNQELAEGIAMLIGAALVASLVVWMWRTAPRMREEIESGLARAADTTRTGGVTGVFLFAFAMVLREGVETAVFLSAARFNSEGLALWLGALAGLALAVGFGVLFVRGSVKIPLRPFFTLTSAVLTLLALQLLAGGLHELSEAQLLPASQAEMAIIGPIVRSDLLLFTLTIALVTGWLLRGRGRPGSAPAGEATGPEARLARAAELREGARRRWSGIVGLLVIALLSTAFVRQSRRPVRAQGLSLAVSGGEVRIDTAPLADGHLRFYEVAVAGQTVRFFALRVGDDVRTCFDACEICGAKGYYERGPELICRNCTAPIVRTSLGRTGGCNPIPLPHHPVSGTTLTIRDADLRAALPHLKGR